MARVRSASLSTRESLSDRDHGVRTRVDANGLGHVPIAQIQRARILSAMFDVACERGAASVSVADVVERSGVSRRTFYEAFSDREDCFVAAFEEALGLASERVLPAYRAHSKWRERIRAALVALLCFLDEEPSIGRLLVCESLVGGPKTLACRTEVLARVTRAVDEGRGESASAGSLPPLTAESVVGGALSVIQARLAQASPTQRAHGEPLVELTNQLASMIVLPFLGHAAARRELERPVPAPRSDSREAALLSDPFKDAGMRLTYRTLRVLSTISEHSGASNRLVGESAGISDQGQISKLLGRLQRLGLISNTGLGPGLGVPNAWSITPKGRQLTESIRAHTEGSK